MHILQDQRIPSRNDISTLAYSLRKLCKSIFSSINFVAARPHICLVLHCHAFLLLPICWRDPTSWLQQTPLNQTQKRKPHTSTQATLVAGPILIATSKRREKTPMLSVSARKLVRKRRM